MIKEFRFNRRSVQKRKTPKEFLCKIWKNGLGALFVSPTDLWCSFARSALCQSRRQSLIHLPEGVQHSARSFNIILFFISIPSLVVLFVRHYTLSEVNFSTCCNTSQLYHLSVMVLFYYYQVLFYYWALTKLHVLSVYLGEMSHFKTYLHECTSSSK